MTIHFECPRCQHKSWAKDDAAGKKGKCPACGKLLRIPVQSGLAEKIPTEAPPSPLRKKPAQPRATASAGDTNEDLAVDPAAEEAAGNPFALPEQKPHPVLLTKPMPNATPPATQKAASAQTGEKCRSCQAALQAQAVICVECGFDLRKGKRLARATASKATPSRDWKNPVLLGGGAAAVMLGVAVICLLLFRGGSRGPALSPAVPVAGVTTLPAPENNGAAAAQQAKEKEAKRLAEIAQLAKQEEEAQRLVDAAQQAKAAEKAQRLADATQQAKAAEEAQRLVDAAQQAKAAEEAKRLAAAQVAAEKKKEDEQIRVEVKSSEFKNSHQYGFSFPKNTISAKPGFELFLLDVSFHNSATAWKKFSSAAFDVVDKQGVKSDARFFGHGEYIASAGMSGKTSSEQFDKKGKAIVAKWLLRYDGENCHGEWELAPNATLAYTLLFVIPAGIQEPRFEMVKEVPLVKAAPPAAKPATAEENAGRLLAGAKEALEANNVFLARIRLRSIVAEYAKTPAAMEAERLLKTLPK